ncbi:sugar O-acetyltransferase [Streptococcus moroccensis]|uniref:Acetyltransferase-like isoleucine patch superfamily enzyme n=1 Tax=Streptococcus moroccensis TaxID=1451356 RepID=A0ABT9YRL2_9STRE|nr:sugar O-acetyltransferase [Streptococcus moroccensis]MDQ0222639.1 acetyltransferase-like isoleucine patch superfamily enzyme [Streptococcus moroccensis]
MFKNPYPVDTVIRKEQTVFKAIHEQVAHNRPYQKILQTPTASTDEVEAAFKALTGQNLDDSVSISLPFYTDFGSHISLGKNVFINTGVMFVDLGGITIEDDVLIAPFVKITTVNHPTDPKDRRGVILKPVHIKKNAWIGAGATILPGITIGENAIVSAGAVVTKDVPENTIVAGIPARVIKSI